MVSEFEGVGDRPWGWWMRANGRMIEDGEGLLWPSVLDAFWHGRLEMPKAAYTAEQRELLLRVLAAADRRHLLPREADHDLFHGNVVFQRHYMSWLVSVGLTAFDLGAGPLSADLTAFGRSALDLLRVTREPEWIDLPFTAVTAQGFRDDRDDGRREATLRAFEREVVLRRYVFAREAMPRGLAVTLTGMVEEGKVPLRRVIWSQRYPDAQGRDDFFAWLAERVDRWDDWGELALWRGAAALTQHLFVMLSAPVSSGGSRHF